MSELRIQTIEELKMIPILSNPHLLRTLSFFNANIQWSCIFKKKK